MLDLGSKPIYNAPVMIKKKVTGEDDEMLFDAADLADGETDGERDEPELEDVEDDFKGELKKWKEKLAVCRKERQEYLDGWQRAKADYLNSKQRLEAEREHEIDRQTARFVERLLPLCDSFDMALRDLAKGNEKGDWRTGIEQIYNQLLGILKSYRVEALEPKGAPFDPHFHEAVSEIPIADAAQDHTVLEVLQKGYAVGERLIRPAKVVVGNFVSDMQK